MLFFKKLHTESDIFRLFLNNTSYSRTQQNDILKSVAETSITHITMKFLDTLIDNRRLD